MPATKRHLHAGVREGCLYVTLGRGWQHHRCGEFLVSHQCLQPEIHLTQGCAFPGRQRTTKEELRDVFSGTWETHDSHYLEKVK